MSCSPNRLCWLKALKFLLKTNEHYNIAGLLMKTTLRPFTKEDLDSLVKYANNPKIAKNMTDAFPNPYTRNSGEAFLKMAMTEPIHLFAIDCEGEAIGAIGIHPQNDIQRKNAELGYWLAEPFWGKGIMVEAVRQIIPCAFKLYDINRLFAK